MLLFEQIYHLDQHVNLENKEKKLIATKGYNFIHTYLVSFITIYHFLSENSLHQLHTIAT